MNQSPPSQDLEQNLIPADQKLALEVEKKEDPIPTPKRDSIFKLKLPDLAQIKNFEQTIEFDTYLLAAVLSGFFIPVSVLYLFFILIFIALLLVSLPFLLCCFWFVDYLKYLAKLFYITFLMLVILFMMYLLILPGIFVVVLQLVAISFLEDIAHVDQIPYNELLFMKIGIVIIYVCMVAKELSQGINTFFYIVSLIKTRIVKYKNYGGSFFGILSLCMPTIQIITVFLLGRISLQVILSSESTLDLVQNFAGLYVILEFDNIMFEFINLFPWRSFLQFIIEVEVMVSIKKIFSNNKFLETFLKEILNLQVEEEEDEEKNEKTAEKNEKKADKEEESEKKADEEKENELKDKPLKLGEDQDEFTFSYNDAFGDKAKYLVLLKYMVIVGMIIFWFVYYVGRLIEINKQ